MMDLFWENSDRASVDIEQVFHCKYYSVNLRIQSKCGKIRTRKTLSRDPFYAVFTYYKDAGGELHMENYLKRKKLLISLILTSL